ncbi:hypothetical protein J6524_35700 [Bradyrhizobium sp. WSM 1738]|uniref:SAM domain-containing protein n=1 Tax=Bradyrhizobium hereditatis TaxID=2821405 RepID=UPI001CE38DEB|nr:SAM domain-containing protein [Bradyrhizobium hereditatis]MCA6120142.1 hypothetical protein [Bradyrhizobium hereditatis]
MRLGCTVWGLGPYEKAFRENDIDADVLAHLTTDDLIGIGVTSVARCRKATTRRVT